MDTNSKIQSNSEVMKEEVDREIEKLEERYRNGDETKKVYKIKSENLNIIKDLVIKGSEEWEINQEK